MPRLSRKTRVGGGSCRGPRHNVDCKGRSGQRRERRSPETGIGVRPSMNRMPRKTYKPPSTIDSSVLSNGAEHDKSDVPFSARNFIQSGESHLERIKAHAHQAYKEISDFHSTNDIRSDSL